MRVNVSSDDRWETCRIYRHVFEYSPGITGVLMSLPMSSVGYFWAEGGGPDRVDLIGESVPFRIWQNPPQYSGESIAYTFLRKRLVENGWDPTTTGTSWWETHFRRRAGTDYPPPWQIWVTDSKWGKRDSYFAAYHVPQRQDTKPIEHGRSAEFHLAFLESCRALRENDERHRILDSFLRVLREEGFESIDVADNEALRQGLADVTVRSIRLDCWCNRFLLRRKQ